jgi:WD repeat-containing protein 68
MSNPAQPYESSRRTTVYSRQPEELHIPSGGQTSSNLQRQSMSQELSTATEPPMSNLPSINVQPSSAQPSHYGAGTSSGSAALPGALLPGNVNRPPAVSMNTAPSALPTLTQLSTQLQPQSSQQPQQQQPPTTPRSGMANSHGHSRSSPSNLEQPKYRPHGVTDNSRYASSPGAGFQPHTPQGAKYSPLGLADIRPSADLLSDALHSPSMPPVNPDTPVPTNSNYIAPWPIYAMDWCKWPISGSSGSFGGKIALGSYLEDNHNYVGTCPTCFIFIWISMAD